MFRTLDNLFDRARGARGRSGAGEGRPQGGVTRRRFVQGTVAAAGAGMAAIALSSCSSGGDSQQKDGEPQVVTDSSQIVAVLDGDYENVSNSLSASSTWSLPLGTMLFHNGGNTWAAAMLTPESATSVNTVGVLSLSSGNLTTLLDVASLGASYSFFDVRCSDQVYAWIEINYTDGSWVLLGQGLSNGALYGSPVQLDSGDSDWEPPRFTVWNSSVIWQKMPLASGNRTTEYSHCYIWTVGSNEGQEIYESHGRFATTPRVSGSVLTIAPRVREGSGVYYGMTAVDITSSSYDQIDQLVLPRTVSPFDATYMNDQFVFSIEASYSGVGSLGNMGTFIGKEGGPYLYLRREPLAQVAGNGSRYLVKSQASHFVIDTEAQSYAVLTSPDRSIDYGDFPATEGASSQFLTFATVRDDTGVPASVTARVFSI